MTFFKRLLLVSGLCSALFCLSWATGWAADVAVVVHPEVPADDLSFEQVRKILLGEQQFWSPDTRVTILLHAPKARERDVVVQTVYRMNESQFRRYWIAKVFRAEATAGPKIVYSNEMATELVRVIPGAIALVDAAAVPKGIKVLKVNSLLPGEKGYPLRY